MRRVLARRTPTGLVPADEQALAELQRVPVGKLVQVEIVSARNPRQHRLLWGLLTVMAEAGEFPSPEAALIALKMATGLVDYVKLAKDGTTAIVPKSISYASMPQTEFAAWFESAIRVVTERWMPGMSSEVLKAQIEEMVGA